MLIRPWTATPPSSCTVRGQIECVTAAAEYMQVLTDSLLSVAQNKTNMTYKLNKVIEEYFNRKQRA